MALLAGPLGAQDTAFDEMDRPDRLVGWEAVGRLDSADGYCTGTLIARDLVLTAAHCLYDSQGQPLAAEELVFRAGYHRGTALAERRVTRWVASASYRDRGGQTLTAEMIANDVALLQLAEPVSSGVADPFGLHTRTALDGTVSVVSYGAGREEVLSRERACAVVAAYREGILAFDCDVTFGSSGAPVFAAAGGRLRILSVISAIGNAAEGEHRAYGMVLPHHVSVLKGRLARAAARAEPGDGARRIEAGQRAGSGARFVRP